MKNCPYCKIDVVGKAKSCPLCQSPLQGYETDEFWPDTSVKKKNSIIYKCVVFLMLTTISVLLIVDFLTVRSDHNHFSIPVSLFILAVFYLVSRIFIKHKSIPKTLFFTMAVYSIVMVYAGWYFGIMTISVDFVIPIIVSVVLVLNFVGSFIDKRFAEVGMLYILMNIIVGVVPYIVLYIKDGYPPVAWIVCLIISIVTFIGLIVFKGRVVVTELQKRLHI
ncbi:MAG: hypothetical protein K6G40_04605 [Eubacterium sp.]|nr:hypothetical protein [Eubacterium sp.]